MCSMSYRVVIIITIIVIIVILSHTSALFLPKG